MSLTVFCERSPPGMNKDGIQVEFNRSGRPTGYKLEGPEVEQNLSAVQIGLSTSLSLELISDAVDLAHDP